jgi:hypothetical protein
MGQSSICLVCREQVSLPYSYLRKHCQPLFWGGGGHGSFLKKGGNNIPMGEPYRRTIPWAAAYTDVVRHAHDGEIKFQLLIHFWAMC